MAWEVIQAGDYGWQGKLRLTQNGSSLDISSYTTLLYLLRSPSGAVTEKVAEFDTDGTDGVLIATFATGEIAADGHWQVQARISKTGVQLTSEKHTFEVGRQTVVG